MTGVTNITITTVTPFVGIAITARFDDGRNNYYSTTTVILSVGIVPTARVITASVVLDRRVAPHVLPKDK